MNTNAQEKRICCICGRPIEEEANGWNYGHNPDPVATGPDDRCCGVCDWFVVQPARIRKSSAWEKALEYANGDIQEGREFFKDMEADLQSATEDDIKRAEYARMYFMG